MTTIKYNDEKIQYYGRTIEVDDIGAKFFNWSGSGFEFSFCGTSASAKIVIGKETEAVPQENDMAYIGVFVDDSVYETARFPLKRNSGYYVLAENLPFGNHTVRVVKESEIWYGKSGLVEISCDGKFLPISVQNKKKLEFIGDSITCGYGNICSNASPEFVTREENFSNTYASLVGRILNCSVSVVAASGSGFFHDYGCNTVNLIPELYEYTDKTFCDMLGVKPSKWDFNSEKCDAVIIKLGQNDGQYCSMADLSEDEKSEEIRIRRRKEFEEAAYNFFKNIIEKRPNTPILFICEEDMLLKPECLNAANRTKIIKTLVFPSKKEYEGVGANGHYSIYTHARVAGVVANKLKEIL